MGDSPGLAPLAVPQQSEPEPDALNEESIALMMDDEVLKKLAEEDLPDTDSEGFSESVRILKAADRSTIVGPRATLKTTPSVADEFVRGFLVRKGLHKSLRVFEEEWLELSETGQLQHEDLEDFPDIYAQNEYLNGQVMFLREEMVMQDEVARKAVRNFERVSLLREHHRNRDRQSTIELKNLRDHLKRAMGHYSSYEPAMQKLKQKYDVLFREKSMACLQLENARVENEKLKASIPREAVPRRPAELAPRKQDKSQTVAKMPRDLDVEGGDGVQHAAQTEQGHDADESSATTKSTGGGDRLQRALDELVPIDEGGESLTNSTQPQTQTGGSATVQTDTTDGWTIQTAGASTGPATATTQDDETTMSSTGPLALLKPLPDVEVGAVRPAVVEASNAYVLRESFATHSHGINRMRTDMDSIIAITVSDDRLWHGWHLPYGEMVMTGEGHLEGLTSVDFDSKSTKIATTSADSTARLWELCTGECVGLLQTDTTGECLWDCSFNWSGQCVAAGSSGGMVYVWDVETCKSRWGILGHSDSVNACKFLPTSDLLVTVGSDLLGQLWDIRANRKVFSLAGHRCPISSVTTSGQGDVIASGDSEGRVHVYDVRSRSEVFAVQLGGARVNDLDFDSSGHVLAAALSDGSMRILLTGSETGIGFSAHMSSCVSCRFGRAESLLYTAGRDGLVNIWEREE